MKAGAPARGYRPSSADGALPGARPWPIGEPASCSSPGTRASGRCPSNSIRTTRREAFYWLAILFTFALGTSAGNRTAEKLNLGYWLSAVVFAALIAAVALAHRTHLTAADQVAEVREGHLRLPTRL